MDLSGTNTNYTLPIENVAVSCSCNKTAVSEDHVSGQAMCGASESGRDTNFPLVYIAYSPPIAQQSPKEWHAHNRTSAIRSWPLGANSLNYVPVPASLWIVLWLSVKMILASKFCPVGEAINLKSTDTNYNLPFHSHTYKFISSYTYLFSSASLGTR